MSKWIGKYAEIRREIGLYTDLLDASIIALNEVKEELNSIQFKVQSLCESLEETNKDVKSIRK